MQKLFDALTHLALPKALASDWDFPQLVDRVHRAYLRQALGSVGEPDELSTSDLIALRRLALYLESETTLEKPQGQELQDSLYVSASIFEFLATYHQAFPNEGSPKSPGKGKLTNRVASGDLSDQVRALVLYSLGHYEANSGVIGRRLLDALSDMDSNDHDIGERAALIGLQTIVALLSRKMSDAGRYSVLLGSVLFSIQEAVQADSFPIEEMRFLAPWLEIAEACSILSVGLLDGVPAIQSKGRMRLEGAAEHARRTKQAFAFWMADKLLQVADQMINRSIYHVLDAKGLAPTYLALLAADGVCELWSSQIAVIEAGLLDTSDSFVVNLPPGAGKSLIAELSIVKALLSESGAWGLYIVPTRALVHQVEVDLRHRLPKLGINVRTVIAGGEPSFSIESELDELSQSQTVTILTPEKLDIYFRNAPDAFKTCRIIVVDEAHKLGDKGRGALLDTLLTRCKLLIPETRLLLLSAVMSNVLEISTWLNSPLGHVRESWRPTRQLKGLAVRHNDKAPIAAARIVGGKKQTSYRIPYEIGVVLAHDADELVPPLQLDLPKLATVEEKVSYRGASTSPSATDHAIGLATRFTRLPGVVVVFLDGRDSAEKCAREIAKNLATWSHIRPTGTTDILDHLSLVFGGHHKLLELIRWGVGYHHRGLPMSVRRVMETALREGHLRVLCTTATLREGLNTPATTVIIAGVTHFERDTQKQLVMSIQDFVNIAGRAGRPGKDTEGQVIFIPDHIYRTSITRVHSASEANAIRRAQRTALDRSQDYFFPPPNAFVVQSALQEIQLELETAVNDTDLPDLSPSAQATLLALHAAGLIDAENMERFFSSSLATLQMQRTASVGGIARIASKYLAATIERNGDARVERFSKTALSIDSCEALDRALRSLFEMGYDFSQPLSVNGRIERDRIEPLIKAVLTVPQLRNNDYFPGENAASGAAEILSRWMNGESFTAMAAIPRFDGKTEKVVDYLAAATDKLSWGLGSAYLLLELITDATKEETSDWPDISLQSPLNPEFGLIPLYIEYGVNNAPAAFLALLGVSERETAQALAHEFNSDQQVHQGFPTFEMVERWMRRLTREKVSSFGSLRGYRVRVLYDDLNLREDADAIDNKTERTASLTVLPRDATPEELEGLIGELCVVSPSRTEKGTINVFEMATRRLIGTLATPSSQDYIRISPTNTRVYGVVLRHMLQQITSWQGFEAGKSGEPRQADRGYLVVKVWV